MCLQFPLNNLALKFFQVFLSILDVLPLHRGPGSLHWEGPGFRDTEYPPKVWWEEGLLLFGSSLAPPDLSNQTIRWKNIWHLLRERMQHERADSVLLSIALSPVQQLEIRFYFGLWSPKGPLSSNPGIVKSSLIILYIYNKKWSENSSESVF